MAVLSSLVSTRISSLTTSTTNSLDSWLFKMPSGLITDLVVTDKGTNDAVEDVDDVVVVVGTSVVVIISSVYKIFVLFIFLENSQCVTCDSSVNSTS